MPKIKIIAIGPLKEAAFEAMSEEYLKRLRPQVRLEVLELRDDPLGEKDPGKYFQDLEKKIFGKAEARERFIALDERGDAMDSPAFARFLAGIMDKGETPVFLIGGSQGLGPTLPAKAWKKIAFSKMTFPHRLFRVMLLEQIYRAFTILRGEPYHK